VVLLLVLGFVWVDILFNWIQETMDRLVGFPHHIKKRIKLLIQLLFGFVTNQIALVVRGVILL